MSRNTQTLIKASPFGDYKEQVLSLLSQAFIPTYKRVTSRYWNNAVYASVRRPYYHRDDEQDIFEFYIPTFSTPAWNMKYYRIAVKIVPEMNHAEFKNEVDALRPIKAFGGRGPAGTIDSETICVISQRAKFPWPRGYRQNPGKKGYMAYAFVDRIPERATKRLLTAVTAFIANRLKRLFEAFRQDLPDNEIRSLYYSNFLWKLERILPDVANAARCLAHLYNWFNRKIREILQLVGRQSLIQRALTHWGELRSDLEALRYGPKPLLAEDPPILGPLIAVLDYRGRGSL